ncbi:MAG: hypothetical protein KatS3mg010_1660 [Acidimicrobiia bacterium]|nr:MAG: hypothetical protein KatS3mg010_1660 [Acidimicrobiia bacterium]
MRCNRNDGSAVKAGTRPWSTATPIALDHFTRSRDLDAELVAAAAVNAGYPEPVEVEACREPLVPGAIARPSLGVLPPHRRRPLVHAHLRFGEPVVGPVVIGSLRFLGLGLCIPNDRSPLAEQGDAVEEA